MARMRGLFRLLKAAQPQRKGKKNTFVVIAVFALLICMSGVLSGKEISSGNSCRTLRCMARIYVSCGEYTKALPLAEKALNLAETNKVSDSELSSCLIDLAWVYKAQMQFEKAQQACERGLELQKKAYYENHPYVAYTLRILSSIYQGQGDYQKARDSLYQAMVIMLENHPADEQVIAPFKVDIAKLLVAQGNLAEAETYYLSALDLINKSYGPDHLYTAGVNGDLAKLYVLQGKYDKAEPLITQTLAVQEKIYGPDHHLIAPSWLTKAKVCQVTGNYAQAESLINKALVAIEKTGNAVAFAKLEQSVEEIRASRQVAYGPIAKANK